MIDIGINKISKNYGFGKILNDISFEIMTGDRIAIVGRNGVGKSTLLKILAREEAPSAGTITWRSGATIGYLSQFAPNERREQPVSEILQEPFGGLLALEKELRALEAKMVECEDLAQLDTLLLRYQSKSDGFAASGGYEIQEKLSYVMNLFKLQNLLDKPYTLLSGGQKTVVKLASMLLRQPDILLLDEPTNHLDMQTLAQLEDFLARYKGTVVMVSHDRAFLDNVATKTILLTKNEASVFHGNYSDSLKEQERLLLIEFEQYKTQQKKINAMKAAIQRYRDWGHRGDNAQFFRKAKELERRLEKLEELERPELNKKKVPIAFHGERTGKEVLILKNFSLSLGQLRLFEHCNFVLQYGEKVALIGDNGTGKTSLIKAMLRVYRGADSHNETVKITPAAKLGYIPQEIVFADEKQSVLQAFKMECVMTETEARNILARYYFFGEDVYKRVSALSGGEKVLLLLSILMQKQVNFLILDEPTNHIDIETREILEEALLSFKGTLLFVSHDRYFIHKVASRVVKIKNKQLVMLEE